MLAHVLTSTTKASKKRTRDITSTAVGKTKNKFFCLFEGCPRTVDQKPYVQVRDRNRHLDTHFGNRFPCLKCHKYFCRREVARRHAQHCPRNILEQIETKSSEWTTHWPDDLKEPPLGDPLREYYAKFMRKKGKASRGRGQGRGRDAE